MKILLSAFACEPLVGSESGLGWGWAYELARSGHHVWVLTRSDHREGIEAFLKSTPVHGLIFVYVDVGLPRFLSPWRYRVTSFLWQRKVLAYAKQLDAEVNFDVVQHVSFASLHIGSQLWKLGKPFVFGPVGGGQVAPGGFGRYLRGGKLREVIRTVLVRYFTGVLFAAKNTVSHANLVLVANLDTREWAERLGAPQVAFMHDCGLPSSMLLHLPARWRNDTDCLRILWVGRLMPRKGVLLALEALSQVDPKVKFFCTIIGDGEQGRYLTRWIERLGLSSRVTWQGQRPWTDVMDAYLNHDVLMFTSLRDTSGSQLVEAMARGMAIISLDHQGPHTMLPASVGIKVPITTPQKTVAGLARALERLAREPETVAAAGRKAMEVAKTYTWDRKVLEMNALYPSVVGRFGQQP
jgi:glycosyltransferase involved in cell wall biosynthesis